MAECIDRQQIDTPLRESSVAFAVAVANVVRSLRVERGWKLRDFSECIGLSHTVMCRTELGARPIDMERLFVLSSALEVPPTNLIERAVREVCPFGWPSHDALD